MDLQKITEDSLNNLREHLRKLTPALQSTAESFRGRTEEEANKNYLLCIEALQLFEELIEGIRQLFNIDFSKMTIDGETIQSRKEKLLKITSDMHSAQVNQDWVALSDLLEYELIPLIEDWIKIIPSFQEEIKGIYH